MYFESSGSSEGVDKSFLVFWILDTEDASETDMAKLEEEFTEMKEQ